MLSHPFNVYTTEYELVATGETLIKFVVSPFGVQRYDPPGDAGDAVKVANWPSHIVTEFTVTTGIGFTVTVPDTL